MRLTARVLAAVLAASLVSTTPLTAFAQSDADKGQARMLGQEGQQALDASDWKTAEDKFRRAYSLYPAPTLAVGLARALAKNGKVNAAAETYNKLIREGAPPGASEAFKKAIADATAEVGAVNARVAYATITVSGPETTKVTLDGVVIPSAALGGKRPVDPGEHVVKATADGYKNAEAKFTVADAGSVESKLTMEKDGAGAVAAVPATASSATPENPQNPTATPAQADTGKAKGGSNTLAFVAFGVGGAGLVVGAITGLLAMGKHSTLATSCPTGTCGPAQQSDLNSFHTMGTLSTVGFIVAGVGAAAGTVLLLTAPKKEATASVTPYIGVGSIGAVGRF